MSPGSLASESAFFGSISEYQQEIRDLKIDVLMIWQSQLTTLMCPLSGMAIRRL
jgi:hypothetical protein